MARAPRKRPQESERSLERVAIFANLAADARKRIEQLCAWRLYKPGESIIDYLDASDDVFFIIEGQARVTIYSVAGKAVSFRELGPGDVLGEYPAIAGGERSASVEAHTSCHVASMSAAAFREILQTEPAVAQALLVQLVTKVRSLTTRIYEFSTLAVRNRIQAELLRLASLAPREGKGARIVPPPTHLEIASRISTHREAVTRELNRLSRIGAIERRSGALLVKDIERLEEMVQEATGE
jgi:CRP-like cAMP-binding protein